MLFAVNLISFCSVSDCLSMKLVVLCFVHALDYAGKLFTCVGGRKMQIETTQKIAFCECRKDKTKEKLPYKEFANLKEENKKRGLAFE